MRRILIFRESIRLKLEIKYADNVLLHEMFDSVSIEDSEIIFHNIDNLKGLESFDKIFTEFINEHSSQQYDLIVIPVWIGNPLQYNGLNLAMHWRLSENNTSRYSNILIYGFLDELTVFKNCNFAGFLNSDSVSYKNILGLEINSMIKDVKLAESNKYDLEKNLKYFNVLPPSNYKTYHSITNEWSILQWSKALKIDKDNASLLKVEESINSLLYYKYLRAKFSLFDSEEMSSKTLQNKGKILFIDDEMEKGWEIIFKKITSNFEESKVHFLGSKFKGHNNPDQIIKEIENSVKDTEIDPDVILLDLRLHDNDYDKKTKINESTGYKALKKIKEHNRGIQVIILTASNKIWNMQALQNIEIKEKGIIVGADGFIVKESPENSSDPEFTNNSLKNIFDAIDESLIMSELKSIAPQVEIVDLKLSTILNSPVNKLIFSEDFIIKSKISLEVAYKLFDLARRNPKYRNFAFLQLFQTLESFAEECFQLNPSKGYCIKTISQEIYVLKQTHQKGKTGSVFLSPLVNDMGKFKIGKEGHLEEYEVKREPDTKFKISAILIFVFGLENSAKWNWDKLNYIRNNNDIAHGGKNSFIELLNITELLNLLSNIFDPKLQMIEKNMKYSILDLNKGNTPFDGLREMMDKKTE